MNKYGFYITGLKVEGNGKKPATLSFQDGFNLISGVSDTGKSYVFSCLNYMLGQQNSPKSIPESFGYMNFYLGIKTYEGKDITVYRKLNAKSVLVKNCTIDKYSDSEIKSEEYFLDTKKTKNYSSFLLELNGLVDIVLKKSKSKKVNLIYSYIRKLSLISETSIVVENSPFYPTGQFPDQTLFQSIMIFLLTGKDFTDFEPEEKEDIRKSRLNGKLEFVESRIELLSKEVNEISNSHSNLLSSSIDSDLDTLKLEYDSLSSNIADLYSLKSSKFKEVEKKKSSILFLNELTDRLVLLKSHYASDLKRLSFIDEGQNLLSQLQTVNCPLCEAEMESEKLQEIEKDISVKESIDSERNKIIAKLKDLESTIVENKKELSKYNSDLIILTQEYDDLDSNIKEVFSPKLISIKEKIGKINEVLSSISKFEVLDKELNYYVIERKNLEILLKLKPVPQIPEKVDDKLVDSLVSTLKSVLKSWNYPKSDSVVFDPSGKIFDFVISGKPRSAYGKGMRAVSYSAVAFSLLKYCIEQSIPFTRNLIIDSPLTTYHGKETKTKEDEIDVNIEHSFYKYFATNKIDFQFIMFDNKIPQANLLKDINYIEFNGDESEGRNGFFPSA
jgi:uncharacterized Zn finger protein (UPF0148 family)